MKSTMNNEWMCKSVKELVYAIRNRSISVVELSTYFIQRIDQVNPFINAVAQVDPDRILNEAALLDEELSKGIVRGPLHGIPITVKDNLMTKDIVTTGGSFAYIDHIPMQDATAVKRLRNAGAIVLGKTNLPDFALSWETNSTAFGRTNNPYNFAHTSGGSSGGEAAILASGGSALGLGTDSGGSIRLPAHYCGVAGIRTSRGLIPSTGHIPPKEGYPILGVFAPFSAIGPMARYVDDLIYTLPILIGEDGVDPYAENQSIINAPHFSLCGKNIAVYSSLANTIVDPEIEAVVYQVAKTLTSLGAHVNDVQPPDLDTARDIYSGIVGADGGEGIRHLLSELGYDGIPYNLNQSLSLMPQEPSLRRYLDTSIQWDIFRIKMLEFMKPYDIILCPVAAFVALLHDRAFTEPDLFHHEKFLIPFSLMGWPSVVVRAGMNSNGLPIGIQVVAKHGQDYQALYTALAIEQQMGGWKPPSI